ncbi:tRNA (guanine(10)-N(2))-dimethyltransferase [Methanobrevibacter curvatus]|uniref:tRNA (guanine(26)-N(2))-dimethyltransferase n=1 Tax=Methanobrevibacter curvatus TaxID=49547 RepID=A0A165ZGS2_9EURY|nr:tRNA (guanine(10)-N(2))-dimethyltransferase [Methanobrevibacter curvatus]KZX10692.1 tRNA (guanine(26)-N(2)/guanine(27)-N(2))-dimethyltransferase [Methanobrevibacter curvatus]
MDLNSNQENHNSHIDSKIDSNINQNNEEIELIEEGLVKIAFPKFDKVSSKSPVFYNPKMEFNRDISVLVLQVFQKHLNQESFNIADLFSGSGIRGIRYKKEINGAKDIFLNDINPLAIEWAKFNTLENNVDLEFSQKDANIFLRENRGLFDVIDIDPFGTPSFFLDSAAYAIKKNGILCVTATDTSALCGTYKEPSIRKYNALSYKSEYCHENGIRILAGFCALTLAKYKKYIEIKFSHSSEHYMRLYFLVKKASKATDDSLKKNIGHISHCPQCLYRVTSVGLTSPVEELCPICGEKMKMAGPLWIGKLGEREFIEDMISEIDNKSLNTEKQILKLLNISLDEVDAPTTFYDIHKISKNLKISAPKQDKVIEAIKDKGYISVGTHFNLLGIKTDIDINGLKEIVKNLSIDK